MLFAVVCLFVVYCCWLLFLERRSLFVNYVVVVCCVLFVVFICLLLFGIFVVRCYSLLRIVVCCCLVAYVDVVFALCVVCRWRCLLIVVV